jgi:DNA-binding transcriptional ArsR family regulator
MVSEESGEPGRERRLTITEPRVMRALAHPARLAILEHLTGTGQPATATELAEVCGLSPSATSYHLRELAKHGLIEEAPSRGDARERVWRTAMTAYYVEAGTSPEPERTAAEEALLEVFLAREHERLRRWMERARGEPKEWQDAAMAHDSVVLVTAEELATLNAEVLRLAEPYLRRNRVTDPPPGARVVAVQYRAVPID